MKCGVALVVSSLDDLIFPILTSEVAKHFAAMDVCIGPRVLLQPLHAYLVIGWRCCSKY
jgi:hypothetical protein